jgi:hypothetical protein
MLSKAVMVTYLQHPEQSIAVVPNALQQDALFTCQQYTVLMHEVIHFLIRLQPR